jgi:23S rRNA pseudouridine1911/1915/1917 synthase
MKKPPRNARSGAGKPGWVSVPEDRRRPRFSRELSVLYEDDAVVVLDKPAGLLAVPVKGSNTPSALSLLLAKLQPKRQRALIVHRIDRFDSGALLFAKTSPYRDALVRQFLDHTPVRRYLAVVRGRLGVEAGTLVHYFRRQGMFQQVRTARDPKRLVPNFDIPSNAFFADASLVGVELVTGLQNQIRAQFSAMGHPVIGDRKYHRAESSEQLIARVALMPRIFGLSIRTRERASRLTANCPPIFSIWSGNCRDPAVRGESGIGVVIETRIAPEWRAIVRHERERPRG